MELLRFVEDSHDALGLLLDRFGVAAVGRLACVCTTTRDAIGAYKPLVDFMHRELVVSPEEKAWLWRVARRWTITGVRVAKVDDAFLHALVGACPRLRRLEVKDYKSDVFDRNGLERSDERISMGDSCVARIEGRTCGERISMGDSCVARIEEENATPNGGVRVSPFDSCDARISQMTHLTHLILESLAGVRCLSHFPASLECLVVIRCKSLQRLGKLPASLERLTLESCSALTHIEPLPTDLKRLTIGVPSIPNDVVQRDPLAPHSRSPRASFLPQGLTHLMLAEATDLSAPLAIPKSVVYLEAYAGFCDRRLGPTLIGSIQRAGMERSTANHDRWWRRTLGSAPEA